MIQAVAFFGVSVLHSHLHLLSSFSAQDDAVYPRAIVMVYGFDGAMMEEDCAATASVCGALEGVTGIPS